MRPVYLLSPIKREGTLSLPMIRFETVVNKIDFSECDTLMFTSKQAVKTADEIDPGWKHYPCIAIGGAT
ncbi:MAG TPA: uroporphyrinogen-III synthase, partial [Epsilonproteobacteria bacterium]|nr:uroporphyrinogen-III synthase [Campylobacterota bacterium]